MAHLTSGNCQEAPNLEQVVVSDDFFSIQMLKICLQVEFSYL